MRSLDQLLGECRLQLLALGEAMGRCPRPLEARHFMARDPALVAALDQFAYRFTKLQDVMGAQLFRRFALDTLREPVESRPIGVFAILRAWLGLLDLGMRPALAREMARVKRGFSRSIPSSGRIIACWGCDGRIGVCGGE